MNRPAFHPRFWRITTGAALLDDPPETRMLPKYYSRKAPRGARQLDPPPAGEPARQGG